MNFTRSNSTGKVIAALLVGTVAGAIMGLLLAPAKGSTTWKSLLSKAKDKTDDLKDAAKEKAEALKDKAQKGFDGMKEKAQTAASTLEHKYEDYKNTLKPKTSSYAAGNVHGHGHRM